MMYTKAYFSPQQKYFLPLKNKMKIVTIRYSFSSSFVMIVARSLKDRNINVT